jgi:hypothetical protein
MAAEPTASSSMAIEVEDVVCDTGLKPVDMARRRW